IIKKLKKLCILHYQLFLKIMYKKIFSIFLFLCFYSGFSQPISLYRQFLGQYDFTIIGITLTSAPNNSGVPCTSLTQSNALLNLGTNQTVTAAYLYWSSLGDLLTPLDEDIDLNGISISAQRILEDFNDCGSYYSAFTDVTDLVKYTGNGNYIFSGFDPGFTDCNSSVKYSGWAIII